MADNSHWFDQLFATKSPHDRSIVTKARWKILREGIPWESIALTERCTSSWRCVAQVGTVESGAIKCVLESNPTLDRCEMVVLFPKSRRATVCVSSQIGCGVGCVFCATGTMGLKRNLSYVEILEQVYRARQLATLHNRHLRNVVFMGMGEPLHNAVAVTQAIESIVADSGFGVPQRCVTVSTSGSNSSMVGLARQFPSLRLAISLHAADPELRRRLMPRAPNDLKSLREAIVEINRLQSNHPVWLEVVQLAGINDSELHVEQLIDFCQGLHVEVNLIPYNPIDTDRQFTTASHLVHKRIATQLRTSGIPTTIRQSLGGTNQAACGQLVITLR